MTAKDRTPFLPVPRFWRRSMDQNSQGSVRDRMRIEPRHWSSFIIPWSGSIKILDSSPQSSDASPARNLAVLYGLRRAETVVLEDLPFASKTSCAALLRDIGRLRRGHHPSVRTVLGLCRSSTSFFLVTPHVEMIPLMPFLRDVPSTDRRRLVLHVLDGLRFLHDQGVVHGDLKTDHIYMHNDTPVICGFPSSFTDTSESRSSIEWEEDEDELTFSIPLDTDAPAEEVVEFPKLYFRHPAEVADSKVPENVAQRVRLMLRSMNVSQDLFAAGFLVMEIFSELAPDTSLRAFQVLRLALRGQQPAHPSRPGALRGLDRFYWHFCLSCWTVGGGDPDLTLGQHIQQLLQDRSDTVVRAPFALSRSQISAICHDIPDLQTQVQDVRVVKDGRDAEGPLYELQGTRKHGDGCTAVKIVTPTLCRRGSLRRLNDFEAEASVWAQLHHPNILPLLGTVVYEHTPCFAVPWMEGGTCVDYFRSNPEADRLHILIQVADALHYLHSREPPIVHGFVRASSILVSSTDVAFLGNFDFQPLQDPDRNFDDSRLDDAGRWTAPELVISRHHSTKTDVFAFAMLSYELYSGHIPFYEIPERAVPPGTMSVWETIGTNGRPSRPRHTSLSDDIWVLIGRCWDQSPAARPSMGTVAREFRHILDLRQDALS